MRKVVIILMLTLFACPSFAKEGRVKYGKNVYFEGEVDRNVPAGPGALFLKGGKDAVLEVISGTFNDNIIDGATIRMTMAGGETALFDGNFIFVAPLDKDASYVTLLMENGDIRVSGESYHVGTRVKINVEYDELRGLVYASENGFYTCMKKRGIPGLSYGPVAKCGSDFGAKLTRVDSLSVGGQMYYPLQGGLWRQWLSKTDYMDLKKSDRNEFTPVSLHRVNPADGGIVDSDIPEEGTLYTGTIKYPDGSSYKGTFNYKVTVNVSYLDGIFSSDAVTDTWKEGLNLSEIERERLRKLERIKNEIATMVAQADTSLSVFDGRSYVCIKEADKIEYQGTPAWIFRLNYIMFNSKVALESIEDKVLIYAIDQESNSLGATLYQQEVTPGSGEAASYIVNDGKLYLWKGQVPQNYESFYDILSGFDSALTSRVNNSVRYLLLDQDPETLKKALCERAGITYIAPPVPEDTTVFE